MRTIRLYFPEKYLHGSELPLIDEAFHRAIHVLRAKRGQTFQLFDGFGQSAQAQLISLDRKQGLLKVIKVESQNTESTLETLLIQSISKGDRMDFSLQKATELGVNQIQPLLSQRGNVQFDSKRLQKRMLHYKNIVINAAEQSGRAYLPQIHEPTNLKEAIDKWSKKFTLFLLHPEESKPASFYYQQYPKLTKMGFIVGPEGGFNAEEVQLAQDSGIHLLSLGPRILRTETVSIAGLTMAQTLWGDF